MLSSLPAYGALAPVVGRRAAATGASSTGSTPRTCPPREARSATSSLHRHRRGRQRPGGADGHRAAVASRERRGAAAGGAARTSRRGRPASCRPGATTDDGDPLSVEVLKAPMHGTAGPGAVVAGTYGTQNVTVPYVGAGLHRLRLRPSAGVRRPRTVLRAHLRRSGSQEPAAVLEPPVSVPEPPVTVPRPAVPAARPRCCDRPCARRPAVGRPAARSGRLARELLETPAVASVTRTKGLAVHAVKRLSRRELLRRGRGRRPRRQLPGRVHVRSTALLRTGSRNARRGAAAPVGDRARGRSRADALAHAEPADRARLRRARRPPRRSGFEVSTAAGSRRTVRRTVLIGS
jgi:hypothetical protein